MVEIEKDLLGAFDGIEYDGMDSLLELIETIKALDDQAYKFIMCSTMRRIDT